MNWITDIVALLGCIGGLGGFCSLFLFYRENKRGKQLDNDHKANDEVWALVSKYKEDIKTLKEEKDAIAREKDSKIDNLYALIGKLRVRNDKLSSKAAILSVLHCEVAGCTNRVPPIGSRNHSGTDDDPNDEQNNE